MATLAYVHVRPGHAENDSRNVKAYADFIGEHIRMLTTDSGVLLAGIPPLVAGTPRVIVLGSMPGELSLSRGEYYANPQNRFWWLMEDILAVPRTASYDNRTEALTDVGIALWDILKHCSRVGSLDRRIDPKTEVANDFADFFRKYPSVARVVFNGQKAARSFRRLVASNLDSGVTARLTTITAPSTSPANARMTRDALATAWRDALS